MFLISSKRRRQNVTPFTIPYDAFVASEQRKFTKTPNVHSTTKSSYLSSSGTHPRTDGIGGLAGNLICNRHPSCARKGWSRYGRISGVSLHLGLTSAVVSVFCTGSVGTYMRPPIWGRCQTSCLFDTWQLTIIIRFSNFVLHHNFHIMMRPHISVLFTNAFSRIRHPRFRHDFPVHGSPFSGMNFSVCSSGKNRVRIPNLGSRSLIFSAFF